MVQTATLGILMVQIATLGILMVQTATLRILMVQTATLQTILAYQTRSANSQTATLGKLPAKTVTQTKLMALFFIPLRK
jgi:hypothetical protein